MLMVCKRNYLKSVQRHKFLILDTYHPDSLYLREQRCEDPWLFLETERVRLEESWGVTALTTISRISCPYFLGGNWLVKLFI
jgi:hypothetical protein